MRIARGIWKPQFIEKIETKHGVETWEVETTLELQPLFRRGPKSRRRGERLYYAYGQTDTGRYLFIVFIFKKGQQALVISARDMTNSERRWYQGRS